MNLFERLKKPFYFDKELAIKKSVKSSRTSTEIDIEDPGSCLTEQFFSYSMRGDILYSLEYRDNLIQQWRDMALMCSECDEAINEIVTEAVVYSDSEPSIKINLDKIEMPAKIKKKIHKAFERILNLLNWELRGDELFRQWYTDGILNIESVYNNTHLDEGIYALVVLTPFGFMKIKEERTGKEMYFYQNREGYGGSNTGITSSAMALQQAYDTSDEVFEPEQISQVFSGLWSQDKLFSMSHLAKASKIVNQLRLIEDSLVIHRITRAPEKKVFYVDTGNLPKGKAEEYVKGLITRYRQKRTYNVDTGDIVENPKEINVLEDFWMPRMGGSRGTEIDMIQGSDASLEEIADLDYFAKKLYRALNVPRLRRDYMESRAVYSPNLDLEREELRFHKYIMKLRRQFNRIFLDLMKKQLLATNVLSVQDWLLLEDNIIFDWLNDNEISQVKALQVWEGRMNIASTATQLFDYKLLSRDWVRKKILMFTDAEIRDMEKANKEEPPGMDQMGGMGMEEPGMEGGEEPLPPEQGGEVPPDQVRSGTVPEDQKTDDEKMGDFDGMFPGAEEEAGAKGGLTYTQRGGENFG